VSGRAAKSPPALVCSLYSEDGADPERETLKRIVLGMLRLVEEHVKTNHIDFKPVARDIPGSYWMEKKDKTGAQQKRRDLLRAVATELLLGRVMFFHVDGDRTWAERKTAPVWRELERFRRDLPNAAAGARNAKLDENIVKEAFIAVVPFYSIESWIYACTEHLRQRTNDPGALERIAEWAADLGKLDEVPKIKLTLSIQDQCNHELAPHIPAARLRDARKSYADTVERVSESARIKAGLAESLQRDW
jgi:hypothetical protein